MCSLLNNSCQIFMYFARKDRWFWYAVRNMGQSDWAHHNFMEFCRIMRLSWLGACVLLGFLCNQAEMICCTCHILWVLSLVCIMIHNKWAYLGTGGRVGYALHAFHTFLQAFSLDCSTSSPVLSLLCNSDIFLPPWFFFKFISYFISLC